MLNHEFIILCYRIKTARLPLAYQSRMELKARNGHELFLLMVQSWRNKLSQDDDEDLHNKEVK